MGKANQENTYINANSYDAAFRFDESGAVINCEKTPFDLFAADAQSLSADFYSFMPEFQPDGRISQTFFKNQIKNAFNLGLSGKSLEFSWLFSRTDGKYFQANVVLSKCSDGCFIICHILAAYDDGLLLQQDVQNRLTSYEVGMEVTALLDHAPGIIFFIDDQLNILECNQFALDAFSLRKEEDFANNFFADFAPKFQNNIRSVDLMRLQIKRAKSLGSTQFEWNIKRGLEEVPGSIKLVSTTYQGRHCCVAYLNEFELAAEAYFDEPLENSPLGEYMWSILDGMPFVWQFIEPDFTCIDCNLAAVQMFGFEDKQEYISKFHETFPEFQPCGTSSFEKGTAYLERAMESGLVAFEWIYNKSDDTLIPAEVTLMRVGMKDRFVLVAFVRDLREQKALEKLQRTEDLRMRVILDSIPAICQFWDEDHNLVLCNQASAELFDLTSPQDYLDNFTALSPEVQPCGTLSKKKGKRYLNEAFKTGHSKFEWLHQKPDGTPIPCEITLTRVQWQDGYGLVGFTTDLRSRNAEIERMEKEKQRFSIVLDSLPAICSFWNEDFKLIMCNQYAANLFGLSSPQEYLDRFGELSPEVQPCGTNSAEKALAFVKKALETGYCKFDWVHQMPDGTPIPSTVDLVRVHWENSYGVVGFTVDMRETLAEVERQKQEEEKISIMLNNIPGGVVANFWDNNLNIVNCNQAATDLFGTKDKQEYMERFHELSPEFQPDGSRSRDKALENLNAALETGHEIFEWMHQDLNGELIPAEITIVRVKWLDSLALIAYCRDLREEHALREERKINEQRLRAIMDNVPVSLNFWDAEGNLLHCNRHSIEMLGLEGKEDIPSEFLTRYPKEQPDGKNSIDAANEAISKTLEKGSCIIPWTMIDANGNEIPGMCHLYRVNWGDGFAVLEYLFDLREEHAREREREANAQRLQVILDNIPAAINCWGADNNLLYCNEHMSKILGIMDKNEYLSNPYKYFPKEQPNGRNSLEWGSEVVKRVYETGIGEKILWYCQDVNGIEIPVDCSLYRVNWGDDYAVLEFYRDLRDEFKLLKEQKDNQERLLAIINNVPAGIYICDENHAILSRNKFIENLIGINSSDEIANAYDFYPEFQSNGQNSRELSMKMLAKAFTEGSAAFKFEGISRDGELLPLDCTITRIPWGDGVACMVFCHDLREQRSYEERLRLIVDSMPLACNFRDENFNVVDSNQATHDLFEVSGNEEYAERITEFSPPLQPCGTPTKDKVEKYIALALEQGAITFDWMNQKADGTPIPTEITLIRVQWRGRRMLCVFMRDMREIFKNQNEQKAARERMLAMINASPLMCYVCDESFDLVDCNDVCPKLMGVDSKDEFLKNFRMYHPRRQPCGRTSVEAADDYLERALNEGNNTFTWWFRRPDKEPLPVESSASRVELNGRQFLIVYSRDLRESIKYEEAQIAARERVLAMVNASPMMCFICDTDLNILDCNDRVTSLLALDSKQIFIDNFIDLHPEVQPDGINSREAILEYLGSAFRVDNATFKWNFLRADGEVLPVEVSTTPTKLDDDYVLIIYCRDLRDHYKYMEEQRVLRERMEAIINAAPMVCYVINRDLEIVDCNIYGEEFFEVGSYQEISAVFSRLHPKQQPDGSDSVARILGHFENAFNTGSETFEWMHLSMSGKELPVEVHVRKILIDSKEYCTVYLRDLREALKFEKERRVARERIEAMLDASPLACSIINKEFNILICNKSVLELFELKDKDYYIANHLRLHPETQPDGRNSLEKLKESIERAFMGGSSVMTFEWMFQTLNGDLVPSEITLKPVMLDDEHLMIAYIQDLRHIKQAALAAEALEKLAYTDSLTGANNRRYFVDVAERELKNSIAGGYPFTLIMLDIDDFKAVNDSFGHVVGDGVLRILVSRIRHTLRKNVVVARYGGEEFVIMLPGIPEDAAERTAWRIRKNIEGSKFLVEGAKIPVTVSIGVAGRDDEDDNLTGIIVKADKALYQAKASGKNTVVQYNDSMKQKFSDAKNKHEELKGGKK